MIGYKLWPPNGGLSEIILRHFPNDYRGYCIDVGASDGISVNTTFLLEKKYRWNVLSVEANPEYRPYLHANRAFVEMCACGSVPQDSASFHIHLNNPEAFSALKISKHKTVMPEPGAKWSHIRVPVRTIDQLMTKWSFPRLDVLCVDTEGTEVDVLNGCDLALWKPKVIVIESWDETGPTHDYMKDHGYRCADTSIQNYVYLKEKR